MKVREAIKMIEEDGWYLVGTKGSHRQYKHPAKLGRVTIAGNMSHDLAPGTLNEHIQAGTTQGEEVTMYRFLIVVEKVNEKYSAYSPDLPGCAATGATREEAERNMHEAIEMHIEGLKEDNLPIPESTSVAEYIVVR